MKKEIKDNNLYFNDLLVYKGSNYSLDTKFMKQCLDNNSNTDVINKVIQKNNSKKDTILNNITTLKSNLISVKITLDKIKSFQKIDVIGF